MRFVKWFSVVVLALATIAFLATFAIESYAAGKSGIYQLVEPRTTEDLFGDGGVGTEIGSPQAFVILDEKAVLPSPPGDTKRYLNKTYLDRNGIYPLQLQTVKFFTSTTRLASGIAMVLSAVGLWFAHRKLAKPA